MKISEELRELILQYRKVGDIPNNGEDAAGYANAILMLSRAYGLHIAVEQAAAMNFTSPMRGVIDGEEGSDTKN